MSWLNRYVEYMMVMQMISFGIAAIAILGLIIWRGYVAIHRFKEKRKRND